MTIDPAAGPDVQATFCATLVDEWVRAGVTDAVACPGSRSTPLALALLRDPRLRLHVHHDERSASFLALGLAGITGRPVVIVVTSGTAVIQLHAAVVEADLAAVPLIVCTADRPVELRAVAAPQTIDQEGCFGRSPRWAFDPGVADAAVAGTWRSLASRAVAEATGPRPGPVHLNLPFREPLLGRPQSLPEPRADGPWHHRAPAPTRPVVLDSDLASRRGVVVAGRGPSSGDAIASLAEALGWPVLADPLAGVGAPAALGHADALVRTGFADAHRPEVVLRVGAPPASKALGSWIEASDAIELVVAGPDWWPDPTHRAAVVLDALPAAPEGAAGPGEWLAGWRHAAATAAQAISGVLAGAPRSEPAVVERIVAAAAPGSVVVASSSMPIRDLEWFAPPRADVRCWSNRGANGIDGVVSTAVGAALSGARTTLVIGDVAFLHDVNGLLGLAERPVDLDIVVFDNDGGGIFEFLPQAEALERHEFEALFGTPHGLDLVAVAEAHGVHAQRIRTDGDLDLLDRPARGHQVRVLVVDGDRATNVAIHRRLTDAVAAAVG